MEDRARGRADGLRVVHVDRRSREHDAGRARRRRRSAAIVPAFPGSRTSCSTETHPPLGSSVEPHIGEGRDPNDPLRRHGRGQPGHHGLDRHARPRRRSREPGPPVRASSSLDEEGLHRGRSLGQRLADALRAFDEEPTVLLAHRTLVQPRGGDDLGVLDAGDHETPRAPDVRSLARGSADGGAALRRPTPRAARPWPAAPAGRTRSGR